MFSVNRSEDGTQARLCLTGNLTIYEVTEARNTLLTLLPLMGPLWQIDLGGLEELDSAGAQLLLAVQRMLSNAEQTPEVINHSDTALELFDLLRLHSLSPTRQPAMAED
jgi:anti-sigma B factor antagonist